MIFRVGVSGLGFRVDLGHQCKSFSAFFLSVEILSWDPRCRPAKGLCRDVAWGWLSSGMNKVVLCYPLDYIGNNGKEIGFFRDYRVYMSCFLGSWVPLYVTVGKRKYMSGVPCQLFEQPR